MDESGYIKVDKSISMLWANIISLFLAIPLVIVPVVIFTLVWSGERLFVGLASIFDRPFLLIGGFVVLIVVHELIHGLTWQFVSKAGRTDIKYGFQWKTITPYAHLKIPIDVNPYRWGAIMPGIVLGFMPAILGLIIGNGALYIVGVFMSFAASGDLLILFLLRGVQSPALIEDHPTRAGCTVLIEE
jgi:hypothetical protein